MKIEAKKKINEFIKNIYDSYADNNYLCIKQGTYSTEIIEKKKYIYDKYFYFIEKYVQIESNQSISKYHVISLRSEKFQNSKFFKIVIEITEIFRFIDIFDDAIKIDNKDLKDGISLVLNEVEFNFYLCNKLLIIENINDMSFEKFNINSRIMLKTLGLITGYIAQEKAFYFSFNTFNNNNFNGFYYSEEFSKSYKSHFKIIAYSKDKNRAYLNTNIFTTLCINSLNDNMARAIHLLMEANQSSIEMQGIGYSVVLETLANIILKDKDKDKEKLLKAEEAKNFRNNLHEIGVKFFNEKYNDTFFVKGRINNILSQKISNSERLLKQFNQLDIPITENDRKIINYRNILLHGNSVSELPLSEIENYIIDTVKVNNRLNFLISALILKYAGYDGCIIEHTKGNKYYQYSSISNEDNKNK